MSDDLIIKQAVSSRDSAISDTTETGQKQAERDDKGRFLPGASPNPGGKPKGLKDKATKIKETLFQVFFEEFGDLDRPETMMALKDFARNRKSEFLKIIAGLLPKEMAIENTEIPVRPPWPIVFRDMEPEDSDEFKRAGVIFET